MDQSTKNTQGASEDKSKESKETTSGRDTGLDRDPKREQLPVEDELEILKSQKGKKVDANPYDSEADRPAE